MAFGSPAPLRCGRTPGGAGFYERRARETFLNAQRCQDEEKKPV